MDVRNLQDLRLFSAEKMAKNSLFSTPRMYYDLYCLEPGQAQKVHSHAGSDKVYLVLDGKVHKLEVRLSQPTLQARARKTYLAAPAK